MQVREFGDPRLQELFGTGEARELGVRPVVRLPRSGLPGWVFALGAIIAAILLFWVLESRRQAPAEPSVRVRAADAPQFAPEPPPLYIPPVPTASPGTIVIAPEVMAPPAAPAVVSMPAQSLAAPAPEPAPYYPPESFPAPQMPQQMPVPPRTASGSALVIDAGAPGAQPAVSQGAAAAGTAAGALPSVAATGGRVRASALANRSTTVPRGTLIPAVLETAFDSTRAGLARAIVSRDVRGFDGTRVLVPRGSRLVGEYRSDNAPGQKRAMITWTRLLRPDGMMIAIDSPAVDTLGRGGVRASVNTHFWRRFGDALLQSTINFGSMFAASPARGATVVAMPGSTQTGATPAAPGGAPAPTLKVPAGKSISIFVAHDLEFGGAEPSR